MNLKVSVFANLGYFGWFLFYLAFYRVVCFIYYVSSKTHLIYFVVLYANSFLLHCMGNFLSSPFGDSSLLLAFRKSFKGSILLPSQSKVWTPMSQRSKNLKKQIRNSFILLSCIYFGYKPLSFLLSLYLFLYVQTRTGTKERNGSKAQKQVGPKLGQSEQNPSLDPKDLSLSLLFVLHVCLNIVSQGQKLQTPSKRLSISQTYN